MVVFVVKQPEVAQQIEGEIRKKIGASAVEVLTGEMRGRERDMLLGKEVLRRFLDGDERAADRAGKKPAVLVSTSAGEVGFDLNADHMVCDAAPLDSMFQRLGRVNRRGYAEATVQMFAAETGESGRKKQKEDAHTFESATAKALSCLDCLEPKGGADVSPMAIDDLKKSIGEHLLPACTPKPDTIVLTDVLLDAWSMTTIAGPMPGRPPVWPWLRGYAAYDEPTTTIAWRRELDLDEFGALDLDDIEEWFDAHRLLSHETVSVPSGKAQKWAIERWEAIDESVRGALEDRFCVIDQTGLRVLRVIDLISDLKRSKASITGADLVFPASFGGIERGLLEVNAPRSTADRMENDAPRSPDVADETEGRFRCRRLLDGDDEAARSPFAGDCAGREQLGAILARTAVTERHMLTAC